MMDLQTRIQLYLDRCPGAISGSGGHNVTFQVACALYNGFALGEAETLRWLTDYNGKCSPSWSEAELAHKAKSAAGARHDKPRGHLLGNTNGNYQPNDYLHTSRPAPAAAPKTKKPASKRKYDTEKPVTLPPAMEDGTRAFLRAAFLPDEAISMAVGVMNAEKRCIPCNGGTTYSRDEWIKKLDAVDGNPNKIFDAGKDLCGAFIRVNPMKLGGSKDADVTAFRHALLEFDKISIDEQWNLITQSNIPCTAVLHSGNKSIHAWVKVDARDRTDYIARVNRLYDHFDAYIEKDEAGRDKDRVKANKNPSRFSRLPGMVRGQGKQTLLALNVGAPSFDQWLIDKDAEGIGEEISLADLLDFNAEEDPNCVLGNRWLCRGGSCLWVGQSGVGKSALEMQAAMSWAMGKPLFGIYPKMPLKSLIIQAENDKGDLSEMVKGVMRGMRLDQIASDAGPMLKKNLVIIRDQIHTGKQFAGAAHRLIEKHKPDLVWVDPLLSFLGDDVSSQKVCSEFFRNWLNPISEATGVIWMVVHHTGKPSSDPKARRGWTSTDHAYLGTGSAELVNWARAVTFLKRLDEETFQLMLAKRGKRAGALSFNGLNRTSDIYLRHASQGICWEQIAEPVEEEEEKAEAGRKSKKFDGKRFLMSLAGSKLTVTEIVRQACRFGDISESTFYRKYWDEIETQLSYLADEKLYQI